MATSPTKRVRPYQFSQRWCTIVGSRDDIFPSVIVVVEPVAEGTSVVAHLFYHN